MLYLEFDYRNDQSQVVFLGVGLALLETSHQVLVTRVVQAHLAGALRYLRIQFGTHILNVLETGWLLVLKLLDEAGLSTEVKFVNINEKRSRLENVVPDR